MTAQVAALARRADAVLVLIDLQERLAAAMVERESVVSAAVRLARAAALVGVPMVVTRQYPQGLGPTDAELERALLKLAEEGATVVSVDKTAFNCASEPEFIDALNATGRSQVVLAGMETHICIAQTALGLVSREFEVQVAADACCSRERSMHDIALDRLRAAGVAVTTSESVMYELVERAATDEFRLLLGIVKG
jgi:nicotinamidase-related amidase